MKIYKNRFQNLKERDEIWGILVKNFFQKYISKKDIVVDVGSGFGEFINNVSCSKKIAIDIDKNYKKFYKKNVFFHSCPSTKLTLNNSSVTKIFISNLFEHMSRGDLVKSVGEMRRILRPGGQVLVLQPNIRFLTKDYWRFFDHITPIDDRALEELFSTFGFVLKKRILKFLPYTTKSSFPKNKLFIKLYLRLPFLWPIFGKQSFLIFEKN